MACACEAATPNAIVVNDIDRARARARVPMPQSHEARLRGAHGVDDDFSYQEKTFLMLA
jgi:hypothetical protein